MTWLVWKGLGEGSQIKGKRHSVFEEEIFCHFLAKFHHSIGNVSKVIAAQGNGEQLSKVTVLQNVANDQKSAVMVILNFLHKISLWNYRTSFSGHVLIINRSLSIYLLHIEAPACQRPVLVMDNNLWSSKLLCGGIGTESKLHVAHNVRGYIVTVWNFAI